MKDNQGCLFDLIVIILSASVLSLLSAIPVIGPILIIILSIVVCIFVLIKQISNKVAPQIISKKEKESEIKNVQKLSEKEQEEIYESHLEYVDKLAKKLINQGLDKGLPFEVLLKEGRLGLRKAAENFDPSKGYKFSTYAYVYMRREMLRAVEAQGPDTITYKFQKQKKNISEADELKKYADLKDQGIITEEEFNAKKKQILGL